MISIMGKLHCCIFALIFCANVLAVNSKEKSFDSGLIDEIIQKHWDRHVERMEVSDREQHILNSRDDFMEYSDSLSKRCDHDEVISLKHAKLKKNLRGIKERRGNINLDSASKRDTTNTTFESIRFNLDNKYFSNNDIGRTCYSVGEVVVIGENRTNLRACAEDGDDNCLYTCTAEDISTPTLQNVISQTLLPAVIEIFEIALKIQRVQGNLLLNQDIWNAFGQQCFDGIPLNSSYVRGLGPGLPNTDMLVIGSTRPCASSGTVAYALGCNFDWDGSSENGIFGRPLAGHINFCTRYFQQFTGIYTPFDFASSVKVGVHEFTHALGFSSTFYQSYVDSNTGLTYSQPTNNVTRSGTSAAGNPYSVTLSRLSTPRIISIGKSHYNCSTITGIELEDYGGSGTAGSHWEQRMVQNEYMAGFINPLMPISYLTLSLFNDMGWYEADLSVSQYWTWGKDQGCAWIDNRCETSWTDQGYFCTNSDVVGCTADRNAKGNCNLVEYVVVLPPYYQHFSNPTYGGLSQGSDFCTFIQYNVFCANTSNTPVSGLSESYGANSLCFPVGRNSQTINNEGCYQYTCNSETSLSVTIGTEVLICPQNGGNVNSVTLNGPVNCPTASLVCRKVYPSNSTESTTTTGSLSGTLTSTGPTIDDQVSSASNFTIIVTLFVAFIVAMITSL